MTVPPETCLAAYDICASDIPSNRTINQPSKAGLADMANATRERNQPFIKPAGLGIKAAELILLHLRENPKREGLLETPKRFEKALNEICSGYGKSLSEVIGNGVFPSEGPGLIAVQNVEFFSMCEHHMLPFWGHVSVAYYPENKILGLSKVARVVELFARRLQVQERLTQEVSEAIVHAVGPRAVGVRVKAAHTCMMMRGIQKQESETVTEAFQSIEALTSFERERLVRALES